MKQTLVLVFCALTLVLHVGLHLQWSWSTSASLLPKEEEKATAALLTPIRHRGGGKKATGRGPASNRDESGVASKWSRRLSWWPPQSNSTGWIPELGGMCAASEQAASAHDSFRLPAGCARLVRSPSANREDACDVVTCLPNLFVIGASKSGTTTLFHALISHPRIVEMFAEEFTHGETHVFSEPRTVRECAVRALRRTTPIPRDRLRREAPGGALEPTKEWRLTEARSGPLYVLEYTPHYLVLPTAQTRICGTLSLAGFEKCNKGAAKFVVVLRDPAKRAFSQYVMKTNMRIQRYNDPRSFDLAIEDGIERTRRYARCWDTALRANVTLDSLQAPLVKKSTAKCAPKRFESNLFQAYLLKSAYYYQLLPWLANLATKHFERTMIVLTLESFTVDELRRLFVFLKLPVPDIFKDGKSIDDLVQARHNAARDGGKATMTPHQRNTLDNFFRPLNRKLDGLVAPLLGGRQTGYLT